MKVLGGPFCEGRERIAEQTSSHLEGEPLHACFLTGFQRKVDASIVKAD